MAKEPKTAADTIPEAVPSSEENLVTIIIDPKATDGGLSINGKKYIGKMKVPEHIAEQLMENMQVYAETKNKLFDPSQKIRQKNSLVVEAQYMADPAEFSDNKKFSQEFGLLDPWQWQFVAEPEKARLRELKTSIYGYIPTK